MENTLRRSFYSSVAGEPRLDHVRAYLSFLRDRNGTTDVTQPYDRREAWLQEADGAKVRHRREVCQQDFDLRYSGGPNTVLQNDALTALLAFVKVNASEAYGVETMNKKRPLEGPPKDALDEAERAVGHEEVYHTRILLGATHQFGLCPPAQAFRAPFSLRALISTLAISPKGMFHTVVLGAELAGVFTFNWMLARLPELFADEPELRDSLERRLVEVLIDEVGHVAFNRMMVSDLGLKAAKLLCPRVVQSTVAHMPEFVALGWTRQTGKASASFDLANLPEEVRRRAFVA